MAEAEAKAEEKEKAEDKAEAEYINVKYLLNHNKLDNIKTWTEKKQKKISKKFTNNVKFVAWILFEMALVCKRWKNWNCSVQCSLYS